MTPPRPWPFFAYLDALRPDLGWSVDLALFATYSADIPAIAAALLAMKGRNNDSGSGNVADFVEAIEALRGRMRVILQRGRLARPEKLPKIAGIFDQFLVEVPFDESRQSWHPKAALIRYRGPKDAWSWRLWLGSRNLTRSTDLEVGLLLDGVRGKVRKGKAKLDGAAELARRLADRARLPGLDPEAFAAEVGEIVWTAPDGALVRSIALLSGRGNTDYSPPEGPINELILVSPFLCPTFLREAGQWGGASTRKTLISIPSSLQALAHHPSRPLVAFSQLLSFEAPNTLIPEPYPAECTANMDSGETDDAEPSPLSLHAKICAFRQQNGTTLRIGSANATDRAWSGRNVEVVAELFVVGDADAGLDDLRGRAQPVSIVDLEGNPTESENESSKRLEEIRRILAAHWRPELVRAGDEFSIVATEPPRIEHNDYQLETGLATDETLLPWPTQAVRLELGRFPLALHTEFIQLRVSGLGGSCSWLQKVAVTPPLAEGRDRAAIGRHLGPRAFIQWVRSLLDNNGSNGGSELWDRKPEARSSKYASQSFVDNLSLEDILSAWARDREVFENANANFDRFLDAVLEYSEELTEQERDQLVSLRHIWSLARERLLRRR